MPTISAKFRRVFSIKPYETETVEFGVEFEVEDDNVDRLAKRSAKLYHELSRLGDRIVSSRLDAYKNGEES